MTLGKSRVSHLPPVHMHELWERAELRVLHSVAPPKHQGRESSWICFCSDVTGLANDRLLLGQIALYVWEEGKGPRLTAAPQLCLQMRDDCATWFTTYLPDCVRP